MGPRSSLLPGRACKRWKPGATFFCSIRQRYSPGSVGLWLGGWVSSSPGCSAGLPAWRWPAADPAPLWVQGTQQSEGRGRGPTPPSRPRDSPLRRFWFSTSRLAIRTTSSLWSPPGPLEAPGPVLCKTVGRETQSPRDASRSPHLQPLRNTAQSLQQVPCCAQDCWRLNSGGKLVREGRTPSC